MLKYLRCSRCSYNTTLHKKKCDLPKFLLKFWRRIIVSFVFFNMFFGWFFLCFLAWESRADTMTNMEMPIYNLYKSIISTRDQPTCMNHLLMRAIFWKCALEIYNYITIVIVILYCVIMVLQTFCNLICLRIFIHWVSWIWMKAAGKRIS